MEPVLLFSGGVDSFVAYHYLNKPQTVYFDVKSRYSKKELKVVQKLIPSTIIDYSLDLHDREVGEKAYIPFRNLLFACQAVKYSDHVVIAGLKDDMVSDKTPEAFEAFSHLMSNLEGRPIKVTSPFWQMTKSQVIKWYIENIGAAYMLFNTISCYSTDPLITYCGKCPSCFRKWAAFRSNGLVLDFYNKDLAMEYLKSAYSNKYVPERNMDIIREVENYKW